MISFPSLQSSPINFIQGKIFKNILKHKQILANLIVVTIISLQKQNLEIKGCNVMNFHIFIEYHTWKISILGFNIHMIVLKCILINKRYELWEKKH